VDNQGSRESGFVAISCLKEQTQFGKPEMAVTTCIDWDYENQLNWTHSENKANLVSRIAFVEL
jgi:hypothetical protein